jgi:prolyl-tRNA editing enzyme YbaK/EbsC (Cys-tRNA(Pro) deacylase)
MTDLPPSAQRVQAAAEARGLAIRVRDMPASTRTAEDAAAACGCDLGAIVKSLVFVGRESGRGVMLLVSGRNRVDERHVARHCGEPLTRADAAAVRRWTGYAIGGIPPFGHDTDLPVFMDEDLLAYPEIWAAAGTPSAVFATDPRALATATRATIVAVRPRTA